MFKIDSKRLLILWLKNKGSINLRAETIKLLEENIGRTLTNHSKILYDPPPKVSN